MPHTPIHTGNEMEKLQVFSFAYSITVAYFTLITQLDIEFYAKIFMYVSAGVLSLVTTYYVLKNKGKGKK